MLIAQSYHLRQNQPFFIKVWIANLLRGFSEKVDNWFLNDLILIKEQLELDLLEFEQFTPDEAIKLLPHLQKFSRAIEKMQKVFATSSNKKITATYHSLTKILYKCEAKLHKIAYSEAETISTPEDVKKGITNLSIESFKSQMTSNNAF